MNVHHWEEGALPVVVACHLLAVINGERKVNISPNPRHVLT